MKLVVWFDNDERVLPVPMLNLLSDHHSEDCGCEEEGSGFDGCCDAGICAVLVELSLILGI